MELCLFKHAVVTLWVSPQAELITMGSQYLAHCLAKGRFLSIPRFTHICEAKWAHPIVKQAAIDVYGIIDIHGQHTGWGPCIYDPGVNRIVAVIWIPHRGKMDVSVVRGIGILLKLERGV